MKSSTAKHDSGQRYSSKQIPGRLTTALASMACAAVASGVVLVGAPSALAADRDTRFTHSVIALTSTTARATVSPADRQAAATAAGIIAYAKRQVGIPYTWGGTGPRGFDCSGLIQRAYSVAGIHLPRGTHAQSRSGTRISRSQLQPGDLVFSNGFGHVQLYIGDGKVVEAAHSGTRVRIAKMLPTWMINAYVRITLAR
jgi:cell wall-associated NlpC family hydrolase